MVKFRREKEKEKGKLQVTPLKFRSIWILHLEVLEFGFYLIKFRGVWILHFNISKFEFYSLKFVGV